ncbi:MAG: glycosyl transferase family 1, partial [Bacteroidetes bacterium]
MKPRKILFLGETFRADAQTWMNGLVEHGNFEFVTWELNQFGTSFKRFLRHFEFLWAPIAIRILIAKEKPDMIIAERTTSYGFLAAASGVRPVAIAQQGITDIYPLDSPLLPLKEFLQKYAFKKATLIHAWGPAMATNIAKKITDMSKVMVMPKGIDLSFFAFDDNDSRYAKKIRGIVTRSLLPDYRHVVIINACSILKRKGY